MPTKARQTLEKPPHSDLERWGTFLPSMDRMAPTPWAGAQDSRTTWLSPPDEL